MKQTKHENHRSQPQDQESEQAQPCKQRYEKPQLERHQGWQVLTLQQSIGITFPPLG